MTYKLIVNAIEIFTIPNDSNPKFYSKNDLVDFKIENQTRVILSFNNLGRTHTYSFEGLDNQKITELKDFFGLV